jgi:type IV pilus assembly protein PilQ
MAAAAASLLAATAPRARAADPGRIDIDVVGADLPNMLRLFADVGHVSFVLGDEVSGTVTVRLRNVRWEAALEVVLASKGLAMARSGDIIRVGRPESLAR